MYRGSKPAHILAIDFSVRCELRTVGGGWVGGFANDSQSQTETRNRFAKTYVQESLCFSDVLVFRTEIATYGTCRKIARVKVHECVYVVISVDFLRFAWEIFS